MRAHRRRSETGEERRGGEEGKGITRRGDGSEEGRTERRGEGACEEGRQEGRREKG